jgi:hypothetical protein
MNSLERIKRINRIERSGSRALSELALANCLTSIKRIGSSELAIEGIGSSELAQANC